jgi:uncharacterized protein YkwD
MTEREKESRIDTCVECCVRDRDFSQKKVYRCELCERWFCERHLEPRLAFIKDLNAIENNPEISALYHNEIEGKDDGHPDFEYSRRKFRELDIEEKRRNELIKQALDRMNHYYDDLEKITEPGEEEPEEPKPLDAEFDRKKRVEILLKEEEEIDKGQPFRTKEMTSNSGMISEGELHFKKAEGWEETHSKRVRWKWIFTTILILAIVTIALLAFYSYPNLFRNIVPNLSPTSYTHEELVDYALSLINLDRSSRGLLNVSLSSIDSGQVHADNMFRNGFFSHWGTDGSKPYMRYTLAGGKGAVTENIAAYLQGSPSDPKIALKDLEFNMMYDDSASNWGHRDNILNSFHNEVSIGISHDSNRLYFIEDFIDDYVDWSTFTVTQNQVTLIGSLSKQVSLSQVNVFYDSLPMNLTAHQLDNSPYDGSYTQGTFTGMALPPNYHSQQGITITAQTWIQSALAFQIKFDLSQVFNAYGKGVYTIYLQTTSQDSLTSYSIWYN